MIYITLRAPIYYHSRKSLSSTKFRFLLLYITLSALPLGGREGVSGTSSSADGAGVSRSEGRLAVLTSRQRGLPAKALQRVRLRAQPAQPGATDDREPTQLHSEPSHGREEKGATAESRETETERSVSHRVSPRVQPGSTHRPKERSRAT